MLKKLITSIIAFSTLAAAAAVQFNWDFNAPKQRKNDLLLPSTVKGRHGIYTKLLKKGVGPNGGNALFFSGKDPQPINIPDIKFDAATIEIIFQITEAPKQHMTLFTYQKSKFHWATLDIYLFTRNTIGASFSVGKGKENRAVTIEIPNAPLTPGIFHTLTVTTRSGGRMALYLDGKLLKEEKNALAFSDLVTQDKFRYYPVGRLGYSVSSRQYRFFKGLIAGLKITDTVDTPAPASASAAADGSAPVFSRTDPNMVIHKLPSAPVIDGNINDPAWQGKEDSGKFIVMGSMSKTVNGLFVAADDKFSRNAASGILGYHKNTLYGAFTAPFPPGATVKTTYKKNHPEVWRDDCIGFFLRVGKTQRFYQIEFNSAGAWMGMSCSSSGNNSLWSPKSLRAAARTIGNAFYIEFAIDIADFGLKTPADGDIWYGNLTRRGASCGGISTWAPVGESFQDGLERFGKFIIGSRRTLLLNQLKKLENQQKKYIPNDRKCSAGIARMRKYISANGEKAENWTEINNQLQSLTNTIVQSVNKGKNWFIWQKPYCTNTAPNETLPIDQQETTVLNLKTAKGVRPITALLITNLSDRHFMTNIKLIPASKKDAEWLKNIRFREIGFIELNGGQMIPDPLFDLPLGRVFRVPANSTGLLQLDINTKKLKPGKYRATIQFIPSYGNFEYKNIHLELTVSTVDLDQVKMRTWSYSLEPYMIKNLKDYEFNVMCIKPYYYGVQAQTVLPDGTVHFPKIEQLLKDFDANGIPRKDILLQVYPEYAKWARNFMSPEWQKKERKIYVDLFNFLKRNGLDESNLIFSPTDEPHGDPDDPKSTAWRAFTGAKFIRSINPRFMLFANPWKVRDGYHQRYIDTFNILAPSYSHFDEKMKQVYRDSGREIFSYTIFSKSVSPERYRHRFWEHLEAGFNGPATVYSMSHKSGDYFNSYDKSSPKAKTNTDYSSTYISDDREQLLTSRRQEAWYLGWVDFKLAQFCREKIAALKKAGKNVSGWQKEYDYIVKYGFSRDGDMDKAGKMFLELAEKLEKGR